MIRKRIDYKIESYVFFYFLKKDVKIGKESPFSYSEEEGGNFVKFTVEYSFTR
jgi:hypothetical protein